MTTARHVAVNQVVIQRNSNVQVHGKASCTGCSGATDAACLPATGAKHICSTAETDVLQLQ